ncbi:MAG: NAD(P)H-dependent oxidoreductase subunit E [Deltaproteobacteria bacterium]|jgi:NADH-quinone oxidoreductase subunit E|nr:NAD(P)H-dependent oxidoreductase subunit E [Deltaproteobacteria bacterium]
MPELDEKKVLSILESYGKDPQQLINVLLDIQEASGRNFVSSSWSKLTSKVLKVPLTRIYEILTFYSMFSTTPRGRYVVEVCQSGPCRFTGSEELVSWLEEALKLKVGETSEDGLFTLSRTSCVGACSSSPTVKIGDEVFGGLLRDSALELLKSFRDDNRAAREKFLCPS